MSADSYRLWEETVTTVVICDLCGWRSTPIPGDHESGATISAFYRHFHASCVIQAAAGYFDDDDLDEPRSRAALRVLEVLSTPCSTCGKRNGWCAHRQPWTPTSTEDSWERPVPDWIL